MKLIAIPLVFISLIMRICHMKDFAQLSKLRLRTITLYIFTTTFAVSLGVTMVSVVSVNGGTNLVYAGLPDLSWNPETIDEVQNQQLYPWRISHTIGCILYQLKRGNLTFHHGAQSERTRYIGGNLFICISGWGDSQHRQNEFLYGGECYMWCFCS